MSTSRHIDRICCVILVCALLLTVLFVNGERLGIQPVQASMGYEEKLFDSTRVHTIDIVMDDWEGFLQTCENEEYELCSVVIDGDASKNVGIRAKGNTSLSEVAKYGNNRYSFKIEFDHYDSGKSYYGLDKLSLNNLIQDNTMLKDYLVYRMMGEFGVDAPLCSFAYLTVNGEEWGLYLAVEGVEESFLERNYGSDYGELYKPESMNMAGGKPEGEESFGEGETPPGAGEKPEGKEPFGEGETPLGAGEKPEGNEFFGEGEAPPGAGEKPEGEEPFGEGETPPGAGEKPEGKEFFGEGEAPPGAGEKPEGEEFFGAGGRSFGEGQEPEGGGGPDGEMMGSQDVALVYSDDSYESYSNIFENAKTDISDKDKDRLISSLKKLGEEEELETVVNVEEVIRYFVVHNYVCNFDSYTGSLLHNYYLYEEDGMLSMIPWDYNLAFGGFENTSDAGEMINYPIDSPVSGGNQESRPMLSWILNNQEYLELYHQFMGEFLEQFFENGYFEELLDSAVSLIAPYVEKDPTKFCTYEEFQTGTSVLKTFCELRAESILGQLDGTIPSTTEAQRENPSSLIDASDLDLSSMGTMQMGGSKPTR